jgi:hypothetical protein
MPTIIFGAGAKGGTGKSTAICLLINFLDIGGEYSHDEYILNQILIISSHGLCNRLVIIYPECTGSPEELFQKQSGSGIK